MKANATYLFAHENKGGGGIAQAAVTAPTYKAARELWSRRYGATRTLVTTGVRGQEG